MSVNGVTGAGSSSYSAYTVNDSAAKSSQSTENTNAEESVVYEPSKDSSKNTSKNYKADPTLVAKMKADADARTNQLKSLVEQMISKQGSTIGKADDVWRFLAGGKYTVDAATKAQAQADIADDGYWGVSKTSERIFDFAKALTGGDPSKMDEMEAAFKKGFKQATGSWGTKLPDISHRTYDAVTKRFADYRSQNTVDETSTI